MTFSFHPSIIGSPKSCADFKLHLEMSIRVILKLTRTFGCELFVFHTQLSKLGKCLVHPQSKCGGLNKENSI